MKIGLIRICCMLLCFMAINNSILLLAQPSSDSSETEEKQGTYVMDAEGNLVKVTAPVMSFEEETYDFGDIPEGPVAECEFVFYNTGYEPLIIKNVEVSCGCTAGDWPKEPIMPGEEGKISVTFESKDRPGKFTKSLTVFSNSYGDNQHLIIKGNVVKE